MKKINLKNIFEKFKVNALKIFAFGLALNLFIFFYLSTTQVIYKNTITLMENSSQEKPGFVGLAEQLGLSSFGVSTNTQTTKTSISLIRVFSRNFHKEFFQDGKYEELKKYQDYRKNININRKDSGFYALEAYCFEIEKCHEINNFVVISINNYEKQIEMKRLENLIESLREISKENEFVEISQNISMLIADKLEELAFISQEKNFIFKVIDNNSFTQKSWPKDLYFYFILNFAFLVIVFMILWRR